MRTTSLCQICNLQTVHYRESDRLAFEGVHFRTHDLEAEANKIHLRRQREARYQ